MIHIKLCNFPTQGAVSFSNGSFAIRNQYSMHKIGTSNRSLTKDRYIPILIFTTDISASPSGNFPDLPLIKVLAYYDQTLQHQIFEGIFRKGKTDGTAW